MGSFNTTCFASQQTIVPGAACILLPIHQQSTYQPVNISLSNKSFSLFGVANSTCYPTAFWSYAGPTIEATYDDYGCFILSENEKNTNHLIAFFNFLHNNLFNTNSADHSLNFKKLYNPKSSYSFEDLSSIWESLWEVARDHCVFIADYNGNPRPLSFAVMHHQTADYLINLTSSHTNYRGQTYQKEELFKSYAVSKLERLIDFFQKNKESSNLLESKCCFFSIQLSSLDSFPIRQSEANFSYYDYYSSISSLVDNYFKNYSSESLSDDLINQSFQILEPLINHLYINHALDSLNIKLSPMTYAGQDYSNQIGKNYAKMIRSVSSAINKEIKEDQ